MTGVKLKPGWFMREVNKAAKLSKRWSGRAANTAREVKCVNAHDRCYGGAGGSK